MQCREVNHHINVQRNGRDKLTEVTCDFFVSTSERDTRAVLQAAIAEIVSGKSAVFSAIKLA